MNLFILGLCGPRMWIAFAIPGVPAAAAELAEDVPVLGLGVRPFAGCSRSFAWARLASCGRAHQVAALRVKAGGPVLTRPRGPRCGHLRQGQ
jgi:hypothetical protein